MLKLRGPSPAMVVACLALAIALSGVGYAAITIPRNSVGTNQLKANAVTSPKVGLNALTGNDIAEATLQGFVRSGSAAGGSLAGTFPNPAIGSGKVGTAEVEDGSLTSADIDEESLDVMQGFGRSHAEGFFLTENNGSFEDIAGVPGAGFVQARCDTGPSPVLRYRDTSNTLSIVWADTGAADPVDLRANPNSASANTVAASGFDLLTLYVRPGASVLHRSIVHVAVTTEGGVCTFFTVVQRVG